MPYLITRMRRRPMRCLLSIICAAAACGALFGLFAGERSMEKSIDAVYAELPVKCAITNLKGTRSEGLNIPGWAVNLFFQDERYGPSHPETEFLGYIKEVSAQTSIQALIDKKPYTLVGLTDIGAARELADGGGRIIVWREGYDESFFSGDESGCIVPNELSQLESVTVEVAGVETVTAELRVIGTYFGTGDKAKTIYCPWEAVCDIELNANHGITASSLSAVFSDNRRIDEFWEKCGSKYFAFVDPEGVPQEWGVTMYRYYPFALAIYDDTLKSTVASLEQSKRTFMIFGDIMTALAFAVGFLLGNIIIKAREQELALQYILGLTKSRVIAEVMAEQLALSLPGFGFTIGILSAATDISPPWLKIAIAAAAQIIGFLIAALRAVGKKSPELTKGVE